MERLIFIVCSLWLAVGLMGCAEITPPSPAEVLTHPFGKGPLAIGMTKAGVEAIWGEPDDTIDMGINELGVPREQWVYRARYPKVPLDAGLIYKTKYLHFEGDVLTGWKD